MAEKKDKVPPYGFGHWLPYEFNGSVITLNSLEKIVTAGTNESESGQCSLKCEHIAEKMDEVKS